MRRNTKVGLETNGRANARLETKGRAVGGSVMNGRSKTKSVARKSARKEIATTRGGGGVLGAWFAVVTAGLASLGGPPALAGPVEIIDDKSDFDGLNFTVIDFETRGDGSPFDFGSSNFVFLPEDEYLSKGVRIGGQSDFLVPIVVKAETPFILESMGQVGSPPNYLVNPYPGTSLRFDFIEPVDAFGIAVSQQPQVESVELLLLDFFGDPVTGIRFEGALIDGRVNGADYGSSVDRHFGFMGLRTPGSQFSSIELQNAFSDFDDIYFHVVPEPNSLAMFSCTIALALTLFRKRLGHRRIPLLIVGWTSVFLGAKASALPITGTVTGRVIIDEKRICGPGGPSGCQPLTFIEQPLQGVCVRLPGGQCAFSDSAGQYSLDFAGPGTTQVEATLSSAHVHVGTLEFDTFTQRFFVNTIPELVMDNIPVGGTADFVFNASPDTSTHAGEVLAASVNTFYHMGRIHRLLKERQPDLVEIDSPLGAALDQVLPGEAGFLVTTLDGPIATFPPTSPLLVQPNYADRATNAGKSSVQRV